MASLTADREDAQSQLSTRVMQKWISKTGRTSIQTAFNKWRHFTHLHHLDELSRSHAEALRVHTEDHSEKVKSFEQKLSDHVQSSEEKETSMKQRQEEAMQELESEHEAALSRLSAEKATLAALAGLS